MTVREFQLLNLLFLLLSVHLYPNTLHSDYFHITFYKLHQLVLDLDRYHYVII